MSEDDWWFAWIKRTREYNSEWQEIAFAIRGYVDGYLRAGNYQAFLEADKPKKAK
jgi:hypothetical protein